MPAGNFECFKKQIDSPATTLVSMDFEKHAEENLLSHYRSLDDFSADFRNYNLARLVASLVRGKRVLDIGCGTGFLMEMLERQGKRVVGIEPSAGLIALSKRRSPDLDIRQGVAEDCDTLVSEGIDTAVLVDVLEHIQNDALLIRKVNRLLEVGGELILVVPSCPFLYGKRDEKYGHFRRYSKEPLVKLLAQNGFNIKRTRYWNMAGFLPYFFSERILKQPLESRLRQKKAYGALGGIFQKTLHAWFRHVENNLNFGFGLSLICVAEKKS